MGLFKKCSTRTRADGSKRKVKSRTWYGSFVHPRTRTQVQVNLKVTDKAAAKTLLAQRIVGAEKDDAGLSSVVKRKHAKQSLDSHAADWKAVMLAKGRTKHHAQQQHSYVLRILDECRFRRCSDVSADTVTVWLGNTGLSIASQNGHRQALKQFAKWMGRSGRATPIDLSDLSRENAERDRRYKRRAYTPDECRRLLAVAIAGPVIMGLTGQERYRLYRVSLATGTRPIELGKLQWHDFRLDGDQPALVFDARFTKNGRSAVVPLRGDMPTLLRRWRAESDPGDAAAFKTPSDYNFGRMIRADLEAADIPYRNAAGEVADFYSLRHSFGTALAEAGVQVKELQELMRHASIQTTMKFYIHVSDERKVEAIDRLPDLSGNDPQIIRITEDAA